MGSLRTGGRILIDQLVANGTEFAFCVPGESYLEALLELDRAPGIQAIVCRMEAGAANMACAYGQLTGRPGVCLVTRGPGAAHAAVGVHTARQASAPMLLLIGQVARPHRGPEAFQEVDTDAMFAPLAKWAATVQDPARLPEAVSRAFHVAMSGRPGPVVLGLPEDVLSAEADAPDAEPARPPVPAAPPPEALSRTRQLLSQARRPLVVVGGAPSSQRAADDVRALGEAWSLPVATAFAARTTSTTTRRPTAGHSDSAWTRAWAGGPGRPTCGWFWARVWTSRPPAPTSFWTPLARARP